MREARPYPVEPPTTRTFFAPAAAAGRFAAITAI